MKNRLCAVPSDVRERRAWRSWLTWAKVPVTFSRAASSTSRAWRLKDPDTSSQDRGPCFFQVRDPVVLVHAFSRKTQPLKERERACLVDGRQVMLLAKIQTAAQPFSIQSLETAGNGPAFQGLVIFRLQCRRNVHHVTFSIAMMLFILTRYGAAKK